MNWQNPSASEKPWFTPTVTRKLQNDYNYLFTIILYKNGKFQQKKKVAKQSFSASTTSDFWQPLPAPDIQQLPRRGTVLFKHIILLAYLHQKNESY